MLTYVRCCCSHFAHPQIQPSNVYVDAVSMTLLKGSSIDFAMELIGSSFRVVENPQVSSAFLSGILDIRAQCLRFRQRETVVDAESAGSSSYSGLRSIQNSSLRIHVGPIYLYIPSR